MRPGTRRPHWADVLRGTLLLTAAGVTLRGDPLYGMFCLAALGLTLAPPILARTTRATLPRGLEAGVLLLLVSDMTAGNLLGLYGRWPWYDKALHLGSSLLVGLIGFLGVYLLEASGRARLGRWTTRVAILLVTLGVGAVWELAEYAVDRLLGRATQTAPGLAAHDDTMMDLLLDAVGGVLAALLGPRAIAGSLRRRSAGAARGGALPPAPVLSAGA